MNPASNTFYDHPILNSPYDHPTRHWELDGDNRPTNRVTDSRRPSSYVSPIPKPRKTGGKQLELVADKTAKRLGSDSQQYDSTHS